MGSRRVTEVFGRTVFGLPWVGKTLFGIPWFAVEQPVEQQVEQAERPVVHLTAGEVATALREVAHLRLTMLGENVSHWPAIRAKIREIKMRLHAQGVSLPKGGS